MSKITEIPISPDRDRRLEAKRPGGLGQKIETDQGLNSVSADRGPVKFSNDDELLEAVRKQNPEATQDQLTAALTKAKETTENPQELFNMLLGYIQDERPVETKNGKSAKDALNAALGASWDKNKAA